MTRSAPGTRAATGADCSGMRRCATSSYMRKWMSERLKRRKKPGDSPAKEASNVPAPEPLQPRFYDNEPAASAAAPAAAPVSAPVVAPVVASVVESRRLSRPEPEPVSVPESVSPAAASSAAGAPRPRTPRRRRGRGGRGGSRPRTVAATPTPAVAAGASAAEASASEAVVAGSWRSGCRDRGRVRGSSDTASIRFRAICCANFFSTMRRSSAFRIWCFPTCDRC